MSVHKFFDIVDCGTEGETNGFGPLVSMRMCKYADVQMEELSSRGQIGRPLDLFSLFSVSGGEIDSRLDGITVAHLFTHPSSTWA